MEKHTIRSVLIPKEKQRQWRWNSRRARRSIITTVGLLLGLLVALMMFTEATGGW